MSGEADIAAFDAIGAGAGIGAGAADVHLWARTAARGERLCSFVGDGLHRAAGAAVERIAAVRALAAAGRVMLLQRRLAGDGTRRYLAVLR